MISPTLGEISLQDAAAVIARRAGSGQPDQYNVVIGTDSQNFDTTKVVVVIALHHVGHGGIFFYEVRHVRLIRNVGQKLYYETQLSLECAQRLVAIFDQMKRSGTFDYTKRLSLAIHIDAGPNGPSNQVIPELIGWVSSCGFQAVVKPDSFAACAIANRISK